MTATSSDPIHDVTNQSTPLEDYDSYLSDRVLCETVYLHGAGWARDLLTDAGYTSAHALHKADLANRYTPVLHTHDRHGRRRDEVEFHPAWHELLAMSVERGIISMPWASGARPGSHVARAALFYLHSQMEAGTQCPIAMSFGAIPVLRRVAADLPQIDALWLPKLLSRLYDPRPLPAGEKTGVLFGMGMTERQGGSDVRRNVTCATPVNGRGGAGEHYTLRGHKLVLGADVRRLPGPGTGEKRNIVLSLAAVSR
ncbi:MAG: hypothetical protein U5K76_04865 [Woeseiaceae bacterium]|nr:hypothetical protein [Woeseiaceae bacterium]